MTVTPSPARVTRALLPMLAGVIAACAPASGNTPGAAPGGATAAAEWTDLLPGHARLWRGYKKAALPDGWRYDAATGVLTRAAGGGDIITDQQWADFELELEWRVGRAGNSGVFYRATESTDVIYMNATEMQILDNAGHNDGKNALTSTGANYALYAPTEDASKPVGEWNKVRIVAVGNHVEHWLNGKKVVEYEWRSPEWTALVKKSKFNQWPAYATSARGHIGLQDHGDVVSFRNIRVRELRK